MQATTGAVSLFVIPQKTHHSSLLANNYATFIQPMVPSIYTNKLVFVARFPYTMDAGIYSCPECH